MRALNVAEKPSVAKEIANILSRNGSQRRPGQSKYNAIYEFSHNIQGQEMQMSVTSVTGHLMELDFSSDYRGWHSCDPAALFNAPVEKKTRQDETQIKIERTLKEEARKSQWLILWLDCDREGENIAFEVISVCRKANPRLNVRRARFSALIPRDILSAVQHLGTPDENLSLACDARSEIDLRIGAVLTRYQTMRLQRQFPELNQREQKKVLSYGPCQFPTLGFVVERYLQIQNFEREEFHSISLHHAHTPELSAEASDNAQPVSTQFKWRRERVFDRMACLCMYEELLQAPVAVVDSVEKKTTFKKKPLPLTTVELQKRASRWLRISSEQVMKAAEALYNKGIVSYPRTETNKFKEGTDLNALLRLHENHDTFGTYVGQLLHSNKYEAPRQGKDDDQAHPPIHPTKSVALGSIEGANEKKVYEFIMRHFLACCSKDARGSQTSVRVRLGGEEFMTSGLMVQERNYLDIYKYEQWKTSSNIPVYERGQSFAPTKIAIEDGETNPPPLLSESDLISKMDANGIGTDATIAEHIKTILKRGYAEKVGGQAQFKPTTLGLALVMSYDQMGLDLAKPALRAAMENDCRAIASGQKQIRNVVEACMRQMEEIFASVRSNGDVMDQTFGEYFVAGVADTGNGASSAPQSTARQERQPSGTEDAGGDNQLPVCPGHHQPAVQRQVQKDGPNKGRYFFACAASRDEQCDFFQWCDEVPPTSSATGDDGGVRCEGHGERCVERTVTKEGNNKGRVFYRCPKPQAEDCGFFQWKDEAAPRPMPNQRAPATRPNSSSNGQATTTAPPCPGHRVASALRTSRKPGPNENRQFYICSRPGTESCGFFQWADEAAGLGTADDVPQCNCPAPGTLLTCKKGKNAGRKFFKCSKPQGQQCSFFMWADE